MVHQNPLLFSAEKRKEMETGGGTQENTKMIRQAIGLNFVAFCEVRETSFCSDPASAPDWWSSPASTVPRTMEDLAVPRCAPLLGCYARDWLWEMQVTK